MTLVDDNLHFALHRPFPQRRSRYRDRYPSGTDMTRYSTAVTKPISRYFKLDLARIWYCFGQFLDGDDAHDARVLEQRDHVVGRRRKDHADRLRQDDAAEDVQPAHAQRRAGFPLADGNRRDAGAIDFGLISGVVQPEAEDRGRHRSQPQVDRKPSGKVSAITGRP